MSALRSLGVDRPAGEPLTGSGHRSTFAVGSRDARWSTELGINDDLPLGRADHTFADGPRDVGEFDASEGLVRDVVGDWAAVDEELIPERNRLVCEYLPLVASADSGDDPVREVFPAFVVPDVEDDKEGDWDEVVGRRHRVPRAS